MYTDFESLCQQIDEAHRPEDLFGVQELILPPQALCELVERAYLALKIQIEPFCADIANRDAARETLMKLKRFYSEAFLKINHFHYGLFGYEQRPPRTKNGFTIGATRYSVGPRLVQGARFDCFQGFLEIDGEYLGEVDIALTIDQSDNHLAQREARALDILHRNQVPQWKHLPLLLERFESNARFGLITQKTYGLSLRELRNRRAQQQGVDRKHIAWMLDRALSALGYVHRTGLVHGAICPDSIIVNDRIHNLTFKDWCSSAHNPARSGERIEILCDLNSSFRAPEVFCGGEIGPWSDIYALGKSMIWCLGGDPTSASIPPGVEAEFANFLRHMVQEDYRKRSDDCWELYDQQCRIKDSLWPRQFLHLDVSP